MSRPRQRRIPRFHRQEGRHACGEVPPELPARVRHAARQRSPSPPGPVSRPPQRAEWLRRHRPRPRRRRRTAARPPAPPRRAPRMRRSLPQGRPLPAATGWLTAAVCKRRPTWRRLSRHTKPRPASWRRPADPAARRRAWRRTRPSAGRRGCRRKRPTRSSSGCTSPAKTTACGVECTRSWGCWWTRPSTSRLAHLCPTCPLRRCIRAAGP
mmetsp:Transcript_110568/g.319468  ORF Transcript_110568/g.319468 Transcript_110568/m.319468 type:complete len:211 (+) Transcript_110568:528-1160(+)